MKRLGMRFSLRIALALFVLASIGLGALIQRHVKTYEQTVFRWPTLEAFTERRIYFSEYEVSYSLIDSKGKLVATVLPRDIFGSIRASSVFT
jgi:hypothetical protein